MSTEVKTAKMFGVDGILVHKHGNSAWHPAHQKHTIRVGNPDRDNDEGSHDLHNAAEPAWLVERPSATLKRKYVKCLEGEPQQPWHGLWLAKVKARRTPAAVVEVFAPSEEQVADAQSAGYELVTA